MWHDEWPFIKLEIERMEREECQRCRSLAADNEAMERQSRIAVIAYEQTIIHLRERIAALECNESMRMDRPAGWNTKDVGD